MPPISRPVARALARSVKSSPSEGRGAPASYDFVNGIYRRSEGILGAGDAFGFVRASPASYFDSLGVLRQAANDVPRIDHSTGSPGLLIEPARTNTLPYGDGSAFTGTSSNGGVHTLNAGVFLDGTMTAFGLDFSAQNEGRYRFTSYTNGLVYAVSAFMKATTSIVRMRMGNDVEFSLFNIDVGTVHFNTPNSVGSIVAHANGWFRCTVVIGPVTNTSWNIFAQHNGTTLPAGSMLWRGQQVEQAAAPTSPIITGAAAATREADALVLRLPGIARHKLTFTFDDLSTQVIDDVPAGNYAVPTNLNRSRIKTAVWAD